MYGSGLVSLFSRLTVNNVFVSSRNVSTNAPLFLNVTNVLFAEPLKKKKRVDPAVIRAKEDRRRRKLEKAIRRLEKHARQLKPIAELEVPRSMRDELKIKKKETPSLPAEKLEQRAQELKEWTIYKCEQHRQVVGLVRQLASRQEKALQALKKESEELYMQAIQIDPSLLPFSRKGPVSSPPIKDFDAPDGEYIDVTRKYEGET